MTASISRWAALAGAILLVTAGGQGDAAPGGLGAGGLGGGGPGVGGLGAGGLGPGGAFGGFSGRGLGSQIAPAASGLTNPGNGLGIGRNGPIVAGDLGVDYVGAGQIDNPATLLDLRRERLRTLVQANRRTLEADSAGNPVRRGEVVAMNLSPDLLARAQAAGFRVLRSGQAPALGLSSTVLATPKGKSAQAGLKMLQGLDPSAQFELNPIYEPAGASLGPSTARTLSSRLGALNADAIGMVDGGVAASPCFAGAKIEQRGFTAAGPHPTGHGTAVASLLVGSDGAFQGAARNWRLLVADVYGGQEAAGSAEAVVAALDWMAEQKVKVVNISLVGPPNALLARAVAALEARGVLVVAAVGNDGPAAPPLYPASYPGVVAVTGVDLHNQALPEAGRASHLDFAAPGADMAAALPGRGYGDVRGTSFAAPLVTARLAEAGPVGQGAIAAVASQAVPGKGPVGRGIVCDACRIDPKTVGVKKSR